MLVINTAARIIKPVPATHEAEQRRLGADRFRAGEQISECQNAHQHAGYYTALIIAADADTYAYLNGVRS